MSTEALEVKCIVVSVIGVQPELEFQHDYVTPFANSKGLSKWLSIHTLVIHYEIKVWLTLATRVVTATVSYCV